MKDTELQARLQSLGMDRAKARELTRAIRDDLHPAAAAATVMIGQGAPGLGLSATVQTSASLAATGAKVGSVVPGIGTAIGAAVGAIAGLLMHKGQKPQRAAEAAKVMADLAAFPDDISGGQVPWETFGHVWYGLIINGGLYSWAPGNIKDHPSSMDAEYNDVVSVLKDGIKQAINAGPGRSVTLSLKSTRGRAFSVPVTVPTSLDQNAWTAAVSIPIFVGRCAAYNPVGNCQNDISRVPQMQKALRLFTGRILTDIAPAAAQNSSTQIAQTGTAIVSPQITQQAAQIAAQIRATGVVPQLVTPAVSPALNPTQFTNAPGTLPSLPASLSFNQSVPLPYGPAQGFAPTQTTLPPPADATAGILQTLLSMQQGQGQANFVSPQAQGILADVAAQGVQQTPAGPPSALPSWALPAGIAVAALLLFTLMRRK